MVRLPQPGSDNGTWGDILNEYLLRSLKPDGLIKDNAVTSNTLAPNSVTNAAIASDAVNATSIADGSITNVLLSDATIQEAKLSSAVQTKLNAGTSSPDWNSITNKPAVIAAGADQAAARSAIGAGVSNLVLGTTSSTAKAGDYTPTKGDVGLGNVDNTSDATKNSATAILINKTIDGGANTLQNIPESAIANLTTDLDSKLSASIIDTKGDLLVGTADNTAARLSVGSDRSVLRADSSQPGGIRWSAAKTYYVNDFGADPTGSTSSDAAITSAFAAMGTGKGTIEFGAGTYVFNTTMTFQQLQGLQGQGWGQTVLQFMGSGDAVRVRDTRGFSGSGNIFPGGTGGPGIAGKFTGFSIDGSGAGNNSNGMHIGDITGIEINAFVYNFSQNGSKGVWLDNHTTWTERSNLHIATANCQDAIVFDASNGPYPSYMYSNYWFSVDAGVNQNGITIKGSAIVANTDFTLLGNFQAGSSNTGTVFILGTSSSDSSQLSGKINILTETGGVTGSGHVTMSIGQAAKLTGTGGMIYLNGNGVDFTSSSNANLQIAFSGFISIDDSIGRMSYWQGQRTIGSVTGSQTYLDPAGTLYLADRGNMAFQTMNAGAQTITFSIPSGITSSNQTATYDLFIKQPSSGLTTLAWPGSVSWLAGQAPTLSMTNGAIDHIRLVTTNHSTFFAQHVNGAVINNTSTVTVKDANFTLQDDGDSTKQVKFELAGITSGTTRMLTIPDANTTIVGTGSIQALTNKTLDSSNTLVGRDDRLTIYSAGDSTKAFKFSAAPLTTGSIRTYTVPDSDTTLVGTDITQTLTNKTLTSPTLTTPRITNTGYIADNNGNEQILFATTASAVNELRIANGATGAGPQIKSQGSDTNVNLVVGAKGTGKLTIQDGIDITKQAQFDVSAITTASTRVLTLPDASTTLVGRTTTDTLTNKALTDPKINQVIGSTSGVAVTSFTDNASAVNYLDMSNRAATFSPTIAAVGSDTNININLVPKGTGVVNANGINLVTVSGTQTLTNKNYTDPKINSIKDTNGVAALDIAATASAVNYLTVRNKIANGSPAIEATGSDTNMSMLLSPKGNGTVKVFVASGQTPTLQADGADTNLNLNLLAKGTGVVQANGVQIATATDLGGKVNTGTSASNNQLVVFSDTTGNNIKAGGISTGNIATLTGTQSLTNKTLDNTNTLTSPVVNGLPTGTGVASAATASTLASRDAQANLSADAFVPGFTSTTTSSGVTTLTVDSTEVQLFVGSQNQTVVLPTTGVVAGQRFSLINSSATTITINASGGSNVTALAAGFATVLIAAQSTPTLNTQWSSTYLPLSGSISTAVGVATIPRRDGSANLLANGFIPNFMSTATAAGTTTLSVASSEIQQFTGTLAQTVVLPTTGIVAGQRYTVINNGSGVVTVQSSGANTITTLNSGATASFTALVATPTTASNWYYPPAGAGTGDMLRSTYDSANIAQQVAGTTAAQTLTNKTFDNTNTYTTRTDRLTLQDSSDTTKQVTFDLSGGASSSTRLLGLPSLSTTLVGRSSTDTLTNKTLTAPVINTGINAQTGTAYTSVLSDGGQLVTLSNATAITLTIPPNSSVAYAVGTKIDIAQLGVGQVTVAAGAGVTINSTPGLKLSTQYSGATITKLATDTWLLIGDLSF